MSGWRIERVVVEADLGVEADELVVLGDDQRIDLEQAHVLLGEGACRASVSIALDLLWQVAVELQRLRHTARRDAA